MRADCLTLVIHPPVYERFRDTLKHQPLVIVRGIIQRVDRTASLLVKYTQLIIE